MDILGIDIGGTKSAVILGQESADPLIGIKIIDKIAFPTEAIRGPDWTLDQIDQAIAGILRRNNCRYDAIRRIGISCGGPLDSRSGRILSPPNLPGWDDVPIVAWLQERYGVPSRLQNDANACALAEWKFGAARGYRNVIFLTFGTGMGAGLILNGRLYSGASDMAGEVGHVRLSEHGPVGYGKAGSFEGFCSGGGLAQLAKSKVLEKLQMGEKVSFCAGPADLDQISARTVAAAADAGDPLAIEIYRISGACLGKGLAILIDILNPEIIVIGSIYCRSRELLQHTALTEIRREALARAWQACRIEPAALGEQIGDYAALAVALDEEEDNLL
ncbi:MAG TPA: sugar kinase [Clostridiales bacterium]|nr:sugar kinase [Clostridiales bacterium]